MVKISVSCVTYNHEKYILDTLKGFDKQITDFNFEVNICDDCSLDSTVEIIKNFKVTNPKLKINLYENSINLGAMGNFKKSMHLSKGEYIAICAGDDYWCDPYKLKKQFDIMEENKECSFCFHNCYKVDENNNVIGDWKYTNDCIKKKITIEQLFSFENNFFIPYVPSYFFRKNSVLPLPKEFEDCFAEDMVYVCLALDKGYGVCLEEKMAAYRVSSTSVTAGWRNSKEKNLSVQEKAIYTYNFLNKYTKFRHSSVFEKEIKKVTLIYLMIKLGVKVLLDREGRKLFIHYCKYIDKKSVLGYMFPYIKKVYKFIFLNLKVDFLINKKGNFL